MDAPLITLIAIIAIPIILLMVLRINATLVFLSLCLGSVLTRFVGDDANWLMTLSKAKDTPAGSLTDSTVKLGLLLLPVVLTAVFMIKTVHGKGKLVLNVLPAAGVGLLGALLAVPFLPPGLAHNVTASWLWNDVTKLQDLIVGTSAMLCLFVLWLQRPKTGGEGKHGKHGH